MARATPLRAGRGGPTHGPSSGDRPGQPSLATPTEGRLLEVERALALGASVEEVATASDIDPWFVDQIAEVANAVEELRGRRFESLAPQELLELKRVGRRKNIDRTNRKTGTAAVIKAMILNSMV